MVTSGLCFVGVYVGTKWLGTRLPAVETAFLRYVLGLVYLLPVMGVLWREGLSRPVLGEGLKRAIVHSCAVTLWFYAMARLPVAEVSAIGYLSPVFVTICKTRLRRGPTQWSPQWTIAPPPYQCWPCP